MNDQEHAATVLAELVHAGKLPTRAVALELAEQLCHIAGGDGRGVYCVTRVPIEPGPRPAGDRLRRILSWPSGVLKP